MNTKELELLNAALSFAARNPLFFYDYVFENFSYSQQEVTKSKILTLRTSIERRLQEEYKNSDKTN